MALTQKQETFCQEYIKTGNASEAYRTAYDTENMKDTTINRNAKAMMDSSKIATRIEELRKPALDAAQVTLEGHLSELARLKELAIMAGQIPAAVTAEHHRGKVGGFYVDRAENINRNFMVSDTPVETEQDWESRVNGKLNGKANGSAH